MEMERKERRGTKHETARREKQQQITTEIKRGDKSRKREKTSEKKRRSGKAEMKYECSPRSDLLLALLLIPFPPSSLLPQPVLQGEPPTLITGREPSAPRPDARHSRPPPRVRINKRGRECDTLRRRCTTDAQTTDSQQVQEEGVEGRESLQGTMTRADGPR